MAAADPVVRRAAASIAANIRWSTQDTREGIKPARRGFLARFEREVDPDGVLTPAERGVRAQRALRAYMSQLALRSRAKRKAALA
jgi:hypothetical protein